MSHCIHVSQSLSILKTFESVRPVLGRAQGEESLGSPLEEVNLVLGLGCDPMLAMPLTEGFIVFCHEHPRWLGPCSEP